MVLTENLDGRSFPGHTTACFGKFRDSTNALSACCFSVFCVFDLTSLCRDSDSLRCKTVWVVLEKFSEGKPLESQWTWDHDGQRLFSQKVVLIEWILHLTSMRAMAVSVQCVV